MCTLHITNSFLGTTAKDFEAGDLGPGTIIGSAAFNLFIITAVCNSVIPAGKVKRIKHLRVFLVTATWSIFAYLWLCFILLWSSVGEVQVWEAVTTLAFFFFTVLTAYLADKKLMFFKYIDYRVNKRGILVKKDGKKKKGKKKGQRKYRQSGHIGSGDLRRLEEIQMADEQRLKAEEQRLHFMVNLTRVTSPLDLAFFSAGTQQGNSYGFGGGFYGFGLWKMKFLNIPLLFAGFLSWEDACQQNTVQYIMGSRG
jgi:hypothetical protein